MKNRQYTLLLLAAFAFHPLSVAPKRLFTDEERPVLFTVPVDCASHECPQNIELLLWDKTREKIKARFQMNDAGQLGDAQPGDRIYSRKVEIKEALPKKLYFSIAPDNGVTLEIVPRPSMLEILQALWKKLYTSLHLR